MDADPCTSEATSNPRKRKQPDGEDVLLREGPLSSEPLENEYEHLSEEDASDGDEMPAATTHLKRAEMQQILDAQEPATVTKIDGIKVTPFNLKEELQEGEFDKAGNFIFKKHQKAGSDGEEDVGNDTWAESIDWDEVERREEAAAKAKMNEMQSTDAQPNGRGDEAETDAPRDMNSCYKTMLRLMKPDEVVKKTIQRLGEGIPKRKPMNKNRRDQASMTPVDKSSIEEMRRRLDLMIELAHQRLQDGDLDIYQKSYEDLEEAINS